MSSSDAGHRLRHHPVSGASVASGERGAALILVLAFLVVTLVVVTSLFGMANAGTTSLKTYREDRTFRYAADSALEVGVRYLQENPSRARTSPNDCDGLQVPIAEGNDPLFAPNSRLYVTCAPIPGYDSSGGNARYVTLTATCRTRVPNPPRRDPLDCASSGGTNIVVGQAQVRFDLDPRIEEAEDQSVVPKIISWDLQR